jgi:hypothetical protein
MSILIECIEPGSRPISNQLEVVQLQVFRLYLLNDTRLEPTGGLRQSILLPAEKNPPPEASLVMELDVYDPGAGDPLVFRVKRMGRHVKSDIIRPNVRSRLAEGHEIPSPSRLDLIQDTRKVTITLQLESDLMKSGKGFGAGAVRHKPVRSISVAAFLYDSIMGILVINSTIIKDRIIIFFRNLGIHPTVFLTLASLGLVVGMAGFLAYNRHNAATEAEDKAAKLEDETKKSEAAREDALDNVAQCLLEQQRLAMRLGQKETALKAVLLIALEQDKDKNAIKNLGSRTFFSSDVEPYDKKYNEATLKELVKRIQVGSVNPEMLSPCLEYKSLLKPDLPPYVLTWHPAKDLVCTPTYNQVVSGVRQMGAWGLSDRVGVQFGAVNISAGSADGVAQLTSNLEELTGVGDPRMAPNWSAHSLLIGLREVQASLLPYDLGDDRPVTAPSQVNLWTLALWDAYNQMPSPADGIKDKTVAECVDLFLEFTEKNKSALVLGQPLLPNITAVALQEENIQLPMTSGCPWIGGSLVTGANNALQAASDYASYLEQTQEEPEKN